LCRVSTRSRGCSPAPSRSAFDATPCRRDVRAAKGRSRPRRRPAARRPDSHRAGHSPAFRFPLRIPTSLLQNCSFWIKIVAQSDDGGRSGPGGRPRPSRGFPVLKVVSGEETIATVTSDCSSYPRMGVPARPWSVRYALFGRIETMQCFQPTIRSRRFSTLPNFYPQSSKSRQRRPEPVCPAGFYLGRALAETD